MKIYLQRNENKTKSMQKLVLGQLPPRKILPLPPSTLKLTLTLTQIPTVTGGNIPRGQLFRYRKN